MEGFDLLGIERWEPLKSFGFEHPFFTLNKVTLINTWLVLGIILIGGLCIRFVVTRSKGITSHLFVLFIATFKEQIEQTLGFFSLNHFSFIVALFVYIMLCNSISLIPGATEPTEDLNTTLSLGIISFFYIQFYAIKTHGLLAYIKEYFSPFFIMLPLNIIGKLATIISMSFRLFGNIFGGATIASIYYSLLGSRPLFEFLGIFTGLNLLIIMFFGIFEGLIQAFVFCMLSMTYLSTAIAHEFPEEQEGIP